MTNMTVAKAKKSSSFEVEARMRLLADFLVLSILFVAALVTAAVFWQGTVLFASALLCTAIFPVQMFYWQDEQLGCTNHADLFVLLVTFEGFVLVAIAISALIQGVDFSLIFSNPYEFFLALGRRGVRDEALLIVAPVILGGVVARNAIFDLLEARK